MIYRAPARAHGRSRLIIAADDFGLRDEISIAIRDCILASGVTITGIVINTLAGPEASRWPPDTARFGVGIHRTVAQGRPELDILVTWNCRHIANLSVERKVKAITLGNGYEFNFRIMTPEEVVVYEV